MNYQYLYCIFFCLSLGGCMSYVEQKESSSQVTIGLMGDVMIGRLVSDAIQKHDFSYIWGNTLSLLRAHDINLINLETTLTTSTQIVPKVFNFKSNPQNVQALVEGNITVANIANNHILDFSVEGLAETIHVLDEKHINHVGAGMSLADAQKPCIIERNGIRIGFIGATDNEPTWAATHDKPGTNYIALTQYDHLVEQVKNVRSHVDCLIVSLHWGPNWPKEPSSDMVACAHALIDAGADIIHGHSAHITLGSEYYNNKLIIYSAGDFVDDYMVGPEEQNDHTLLYQIIIDKNGIQKVALFPCIIDNMQVNRATGNQVLTILSRIQTLSKQLNTHFIVDNETLVLKK